MIKHPRFRHTFMLIGSIMVVILYILTDPVSGFLKDLPFGASTIVLISTLLKSVWFIGFLHASRRALLDYFDMDTFFRIAQQTPEGAGSSLIAVGLIMIAAAICIAAAVMSN